MARALTKKYSPHSLNAKKMRSAPSSTHPNVFKRLSTRRSTYFFSISVAYFFFVVLPSVNLVSLNSTTVIFSEAYEAVNEKLTVPIVKHQLSPSKRLETAYLYGGIYDYAYYFIDILVGTPPQRQSVIVDSGSSILGFPCNNCVDCGKQHIDKYFNIQNSTTARWVSCHHPKCLTHSSCGVADKSGVQYLSSNAAGGDSWISAIASSIKGSDEEAHQTDGDLERCSYTQRYSEGSSIGGNYFSDKVAIGDDFRNNSFVRFDYIGCHDKETNLFTSQKANGIMGISYPKRGKQQTIMDALFGADDVDTKVFALCVAEVGGLMTIGGYNSSLHRKSRTAAGGELLRKLSVDQADRLDALRWLEEEEKKTEENKKGSDMVVAEESVESKYSGGNVFSGLQDILGLYKEETTKEQPSIPIAWTKITSTSSYQIDLIELSVFDTDGEKTSKVVAGEADFGQSIVDSGTTFSYFASPVFHAIIASLNASCRAASASFCIERNSASIDDMCWRIEDDKSFGLMPVFLFKLRGDATVEWNARSYLHQRGTSSVWCVALDDNGKHNTILGMSFMKGKNVIFDREKDYIGFVEADCPIVNSKSRPLPPIAAAHPRLPSSTLPPPSSPFPSTLSLSTLSISPSSSSPPSPSSIPVEDSSLAADSSETVLWAVSGSAVSLILMSMAVISCQSLRSSRAAYQPMTNGELPEVPPSLSRDGTSERLFPPRDLPNSPEIEV